MYFNLKMLELGFVKWIDVRGLVLIVIRSHKLW